MKTTRFWQTSPVATPTGATARAIAAWPRTSSGLVGSSIQYGSKPASAFTCRIASGTSQHWFASSMSRRPGPISSRISAARRAFSSRLGPTFILKAVHPSATASRQSRRTFSSG